MESSTSPERPTKRQRARKACIPCRKRKRKCDGNFPCSMCSTYGYNCQFPPDEGPAAPYAEHPHPLRVEEKSKPPDSTPSETRDREKERSQSPDAVDRGILDPFKGRFMGLHSAVAFPRSLGLDLQSSNPPRIHSFGWNCGIRSEEPPPSHFNLSSILTKEDFDRYVAVYFEAVHPIFGIIDPGIFKKNSDAYWAAPGKTRDWNAVMASVVALGSFFSAAEAHPNEHLLVAHAKQLLEDPLYVRAPTLNLVTAQVLRTLYLRATTRPHVSWLSSCIALHCAEATGLHREIDRGVVLTSDQESPPETTTNLKPNQPQPNGQQNSWGFGRRREGCEVTRRLFWSAWAMNRMISYEYGRSYVVLNGITTKPPKETEGDFTFWYIQLAKMIPATQPGTHQMSGPVTGGAYSNTAENLLKALARIDEIPDSHPCLTLSKADLALCIYRRLRLLSPFPCSAQHALSIRIITLGIPALKASLDLTAKNQFWWQVLYTPFQYLCVLLAIDDSRSLREMRGAMETLEKVSQTLGTYFSGEAVNTAKLLIRDSRRKKRRELELLDAVVGGEEDVEEVVGDTGLRGVGTFTGGVGVVRRGMDTTPGWNWEGEEVDWNALLDPGFGFLPADFGTY